MRDAAGVAAMVTGPASFPAQQRAPTAAFRRFSRHGSIPPSAGSPGISGLGLWVGLRIRVGRGQKGSLALSRSEVLKDFSSEHWFPEAHRVEGQWPQQRGRRKLIAPILGTGFLPWAVGDVYYGLRLKRPQRRLKDRNICCWGWGKEGWRGIWSLCKYLMEGYKNKRAQWQYQRQQVQTEMWNFIWTLNTSYCESSQTPAQVAQWGWVSMPPSLEIIKPQLSRALTLGYVIHRGPLNCNYLVTLWTKPVLVLGDGQSLQVQLL